MKFESHHEVLLNRIGPAFEGAVSDVINDAERRAPKRTGRFAASIEHSSMEHSMDRHRTTVGSPLSSARVKEMGGFMEAKRSPWLTFRVNGEWRKVKSVRVPAQPTVGPAARNFPRYMGDRLRALSGGVLGGGLASFRGPRADFRSGMR